jgi:hypothetical protein
MWAALGRVRARVGVKDDFAIERWVANKLGVDPCKLNLDLDFVEPAGAGNEKATQARLTFYILLHRLDYK